MKFNPQEKKVIVVSRPDDANMVEVNFYRPDIEGTAVVTPGFPSSQIMLSLLFLSRGLESFEHKLSFSKNQKNK